MTNILGVCIVAAQLTHGGNYTTQPIYTDAYSYDGVKRNVEKFYKPKSQSIYAGGDIYLDSTKISLNYDSGTKAEKYKRADTLGVQVTQHIPVTKNFSINLTGGYVFGGKESHTSCKDSYNREYFCGNLTAWKDFEHVEQDKNYNAGIRFNWKF